MKKMFPVFLLLLGGCMPFIDKHLVREGIHMGRMMMDDLDEEEKFEPDETLRAQVRLLKEELGKVRSEKNKMLLEHLSQEEIQKIKDLTMKEKNIHHSGHINIHNYVLKSNHLSDEAKAAIQAKIAWHEQELRSLRCTGY